MKREIENHVKKVKLFLSSTFDQSMISQRDLFRNELRFRLEEELGQYGVYFYLYDFELGIPMNTKPERVIQICLRAVEASNMFIGIIGNEYGTPIQSFIKDVVERERLKQEYPVLADAIDRNVSVLELEFIYAMNFKSKKKMFIVIKKNEDKRCGKIISLIAKIKQSGQKCQEIVDYKDIKNSVIQWVLNMVSGVSGIIKPSKLIAYAIRKTKYYVEDKQISDIYQYLEGSSKKVLCIYGDKGSGKTVMVARMYLEQYFQGMCFVFAGHGAYTLSEVILLLLKQLYKYYEMKEEKLNAVYSEREYVQLFQEMMKTISLYPSKCCLIIDGVEKIHILDVFSVNVILPDKLPKNVKMIITTKDKSLISDKKVSFLQHPSVDTYKMLERMLYAEGKQGERIYIERNRVFRKRTEISLEYAYVFISELIATAKYNTIKIMLYKQAFQAGTLADLYFGFLQRILGRFPDKSNYIKSLMLYLVYTENGLTERELELLIGNVDNDIISFVYPYLEITGERRMLISSEELRSAVCRLWGVGEEQEQEFRRNIINICFSDAEEDPVLGREILYQLIYVQEETLTERILNNIQIVDSITYYNEKYTFNQLQKFLNFKKYLHIWSKIKVTEDNYIYILTIVNLELKQGMLDSAQRHLEAMLVLLNQGKIMQNYEIKIYNYLSVLYANKLQYDEASKYAKDAIKVGKKNGESSFQLCELKNILCRIYLNTGHHETAYTFACRLLELYKNPFYEDTVNILRINITLLHILYGQGRDKEYQKEYMRLLPRIKTIFGKNHSEVTDVRILNINYLTRRGYLERALEQCSRIMKIMKYDSKYQLELLLVECDIYYYMRDWEKEEKSLMQVGSLLEEEGKKETPIAISWYEKNMYYYLETGKPKEALKFGENIQYLLNECNASDLWKINNFLDIGVVYENMGMNRNAMECYENAVKILSRKKGISEIKEAYIYNQIGSCTQNMQLYAKSYRAYKKALNILKNSYFQGELYGIILNNMGQLMQETNHMEEALNYYGKALKFYWGYFSDDNNMHIANTIDNVGSIFDMREEYRKATYFHLKGLQYRLKNGGLYTPSTVTSLHNLANTLYLVGNWFWACIVESIAVQGLKKQEVSVDDYSVYMCMGKILEHMHLRNLAFRYYIQAYHILNRKKEIVSETAEIYLIVATFVENWERYPDSIKKLLKANMLLNNKKKLYRKDYELKVAVYFSIERYYCYQGNYDKALRYLDYAEELIDYKLGREEYSEIVDTISIVRTEIKNCKEE